MKRVQLQPLDDGDRVVGLIAIVVLVVGLIWLIVVRDGGPSESRVPPPADTAADTASTR